MNWTYPTFQANARDLVKVFSADAAVPIMRIAGHIVERRAKDSLMASEQVGWTDGVSRDSEHRKRLERHVLPSSEAEEKHVSRHREAGCPVG